MHIRPVILFVSAMLVTTGSLALAQSAGEAPKSAPVKQGPCHDDIQKFCKQVHPGGGRVHACLEKHEAELSGACRDARQQAKERIAKFEQACNADIQKLCKGVKAGGGRVVKCLKAKEAELSPACKAEFQASRPAAAQVEQ
jgi:hypothetical protein